MSSLRVLLGLAVLSVTGVATAAVLVDNGTPNGGSAFQSTTSASPSATETYAASPFTIASTSTANSIVFYGIYGSGNIASTADAFTIAFYNDAGGQPGTLLASRPATSLTRTLAGGSLWGLWTQYQYTATFNDVVLPDSNFWLSIQDVPSGTTDAWYWLTSAGTGPTAYSTNSGADWQLDPAYKLAFQLGGVVPEPAIAGSLLLGATIIAARRKREAIAK